MTEKMSDKRGKNYQILTHSEFPLSGSGFGPSLVPI